MVEQKGSKSPATNFLKARLGPICWAQKLISEAPDTWGSNGGWLIVARKHSGSGWGTSARPAGTLSGRKSGPGIRKEEGMLCSELLKAFRDPWAWIRDNRDRGTQMKARMALCLWLDDLPCTRCSTICFICMRVVIFLVVGQEASSLFSIVLNKVRPMGISFRNQLLLTLGNIFP